MTRSTPFRLLAACLLAAACSRGRVAEIAPASEPYDVQAGVASFDTAWARIDRTYYDSTFQGVNWKALKDTLRPRVQNARSINDVRRAIKTLFDTLGESHFAIIPGDVARAMRGDSARGSGAPGTSGLTFRMVDGHVLVTAVRAGSAADRAGIHTGWEVLRVGSHDALAMLAAQRSLGKGALARRAGLQLVLRLETATNVDAGDRVALDLRDGTGRTRHLELVADEAPGEVVKYLSLPPQMFHLEHQRVADASGCIGTIRFNTWMLPVMPALEKAIEVVGDCRGVVLDLRGNLGGVAGLLMGVSGFFVDTALSLGAVKARTTTLQYVVNPRRSNRRGQVVRPYAGRLAIVVDAMSASASELFTEGLRVLGRARVFGDTTAGEALPAALARLPNGDLLMHVIADFHTPDGRRIEATGVVPDVVIPLRRTHLLKGGDFALEAAIAWAGSPVARAQGKSTVSVPR